MMHQLRHAVRTRDGASLQARTCPAGLLPAWDAIPRWWKWYGYINPLRYGYGAVAINAFEGRQGVMLGGLPVR